MRLFVRIRHYNFVAVLLIVRQIGKKKVCVALIVEKVGAGSVRGFVVGYHRIAHSARIIAQVAGNRKR